MIRSYVINDMLLQAISFFLPVKRVKKKRFWPNTKRSYYEILPDIESVGDYPWLKKPSMAGIDLNEAGQLQLLDLFVSKYKREYDSIPREKPEGGLKFYVFNDRFETVDCEILYCMVRHFKPRKMIEIGSGFSTLMAAEAILKNKAEDGSYDCELVAIDPFPLDMVKSGFPGLTRLIEKKAQDMPFSTFENLGENDILFIDSTHILSIGNDVHYEYLEILPNLKKGVVVHVHDIFVPAEFPAYHLNNYMVFTEQYLLQAFLSFNDSFEVLWAGSHMCTKYTDKVEAAFSSYNRSIGPRASFWMRRIK